MLIAAKSSSVKIFLESDTNYSLMLKNGSLRLTRKDSDYKFKVKKDKCKWPIVKHIHTPSDLYSYLIHVLDGPKWRMVGTKYHFQIKNGLYCVTGLTDIIKGCNIDYPMIVSPCCDSDKNQWFTTSKLSNVKEMITIISERKRTVGFPYEKYINFDKACNDEGKKGGENDEYSITKRIDEKVKRLKDDECNDCIIKIDKNEECNEKVIKKVKKKDTCEMSDDSDDLFDTFCEDAEIDTSYKPEMVVEDKNKDEVDDKNMGNAGSGNIKFKESGNSENKESKAPFLDKDTYGKDKTSGVQKDDENADENDKDSEENDDIYQKEGEGNNVQNNGSATNNGQDKTKPDEQVNNNSANEPKENTQNK
ncbi:hypothetical protein BDAP_000239 [Binucleata daphniae]